MVTLIFQISDATPKLYCSLGYVTPLIFSCLVLGAYLFFDLLLQHIVRLAPLAVRVFTPLMSNSR